MLNEIWTGIKTAALLVAVFYAGYFFGLTDTKDGDNLLTYCYPFLTNVYEQGQYPDVCIPKQVKQQLQFTPPAHFRSESPSGTSETPIQEPCPAGTTRIGAFECKVQ